MENIVHYDLNDYIYSYEFNKAISKMKEGLNYTNYSLEELINMIEIEKFFDDFDSLNEEGQKLLTPFLNEKREIKKAINCYFNNLTSNKVLYDFENIKSKHLHLSSYFETFVKFEKYNILTEEQFAACIEKEFFTLGCILIFPKLVEKFKNIIIDLIFKTPYSAEFFVQAFDVSKKDSNMAKSLKFFNDKIDDIVMNYLNWENVNLNYVKALNNHRNNTQSYILSRATKVKINETIKKINSNFSNEEGFKYSIGLCVKIDKNQNKCMIFKQNKSTEFEFSYSYDFLKSDLTYENIMKRMLSVFGLVDSQGRINNLFNLNNESVLSRSLLLESKNCYGSDTFDLFELFKNACFKCYHDFLLGEDIDFSNVLQWFMDTYICSKLKGLKFYGKLKHTEDYNDNCERLFNQITGYLKQYKIFLEEGTITETLVAFSKDQIRVNDIPSLNENKYYELNEKNAEIKNILNLLFNDQSALSYIDENINANNFCELLNSHKLKLENFNNKISLEQVKYLINKGIVSEGENGFLDFVDTKNIMCFGDLYKNRFVAYNKLENTFKIIYDKFLEKGYVIKRNTLFSKYEIEYFSYYLDDSKFDNALGLRNLYLHNNGVIMSEEDNMKNYLIGLRLLTEISFKICDDIEEYLANKAQSN